MQGESKRSESVSMGSLCLECLEYSSGKMYKGVLKEALSKSVKDVGEYKRMSNKSK